MKHGTALKSALIACIVACFVAFVGCSAGQSATATDEQKANSAYMLQVNETMVELDDSLSLFVDAVSRGDVVNMRTQAENAYKSLDKLAGIEAPEALSDIKKNYVEGTEKLREALDGYIDLYTEAANSRDEVEADSFNEKIAQIQKLYDEGIAALKAGDEAAANLGVSSQSAASSDASAASGESAASAPASSDASSSAAA